MKLYGFDEFRMPLRTYQHSILNPFKLPSDEVVALRKEPF